MIPLWQFVYLFVTVIIFPLSDIFFNGVFIYLFAFIFGKYCK